MRKLIVLVIAAVAALVLFPSGAFAASIPAEQLENTNSLGRVTLSAATVTWLLSALIPIVVGILTKMGNRFKPILMLVLNAVNALIVQATMADGSAVIDKSTFVQFLFGVVVSVASYYGVWKPLNVTSSTPDGKLGPNTGL